MFVNEVVVALSIAKTLDNEMIERASDLERVKSLQRVINAKIDIKFTPAPAGMPMMMPQK